MSAEIKDLAARARENKLKQEELDKGTFTVSNLGMYDVVEFGAIITVPQAGILAVGTVRETPVVRDGEIVVGNMMYITVSADHRVADGAVAAEFVREVKRLLEAPMGLLV
jgi:pyruvate dehydrogenase E2 component (dihydrolipoamide acetyltransferase)